MAVDLALMAVLKKSSTVAGAANASRHDASEMRGRTMSFGSLKLAICSYVVISRWSLQREKGEKRKRGKKIAL